MASAAETEAGVQVRRLSGVAVVQDGVVVTVRHFVRAGRQAGGA